MKTTETGDRSLLCAVTRTGDGSPLYIVPSVGMTALSLINLARSIEPPRPGADFGRRHRRRIVDKYRCIGHHLDGGVYSRPVFVGKAAISKVCLVDSPER